MADATGSFNMFRSLFLALGAWRLARPMRSTMGRLFAVIAYLAVPLPYNALARGHWGALVAYAEMCGWTLARVGQ